MEKKHCNEVEMANLLLSVTLTLGISAVLGRPSSRCTQTDEFLRIFEEWNKDEPIEFGKVWPVCSEEDIQSALDLVHDQLVVLSLFDFGHVEFVDVEFLAQLVLLGEYFPKVLFLAADVGSILYKPDNVEKIPSFVYILKNHQLVGQFLEPDSEKVAEAILHYQEN